MNAYSSKRHVDPSRHLTSATYINLDGSEDLSIGLFIVHPGVCSLYPSSLCTTERGCLSVARFWR